jgi:hypothetical protein
MADPSRFRRFCSFMAFAVMLQMFVLQAMAASGDLHKHFHDHCDDPSHECAVTLMLHGGYDSDLPDIVPVDLISEPPEILPVIAPIARDIEPSHLAGGVLAHAPPRGP